MTTTTTSNLDPNQFAFGYAEGYATFVDDEHAKVDEPTGRNRTSYNLGSYAGFVDAKGGVIRSTTTIDAAFLKVTQEVC